MKLNKLLTDEVRSTFTPLTQDAEGELKGGFGSLLGTAPDGINANNNCLCSGNNCSCPTLQKTKPMDNCDCPEGASPYSPILGGNNCKCVISGDTNNCDCSVVTTTKGSNGLFLPALF